MQPWKIVLETCPTLRYYTFKDGFLILEGLRKQISDKNSPEYKKYFEELMHTHDVRMKYIPDFQTRMKGVPSVADALGDKAACIYSVCSVTRCEPSLCMV